MLIKELVTKDGKIPVLRCGSESNNYNDFEWPHEGHVEAPDWNPEPVCGGGLHGWAWGIGIGDGKRPEVLPDSRWWVVAVSPNDMVTGVGGGYKVKFRRGEIIYCGDWIGAAWVVVDKMREHPQYASMRVNDKDHNRVVLGVHPSIDSNLAAPLTTVYNAALAINGRSRSTITGGGLTSVASSCHSAIAMMVGDGSCASSSGTSSITAISGVSSVAAASGRNSLVSTFGVNSIASTAGRASEANAHGHDSIAAATGCCSLGFASGRCSVAASTGINSIVTAGGDASVAVSTGRYSHAKSGRHGVIVLAYKTRDEVRLRCAEVGVGDGSDGKLKANTLYRLDDDGNFVEVE